MYSINYLSFWKLGHSSGHTIKFKKPIASMMPIKSIGNFRIFPVSSNFHIRSTLWKWLGNSALLSANKRGQRHVLTMPFVANLSNGKVAWIDMDNLSKPQMLRKIVHTENEENIFGHKNVVKIPLVTLGVGVVSSVTFQLRNIRRLVQKS